VAKRLDGSLSFWHTGWVGHRNIVLDGHLNPTKIGELGAPKLWVQWEGIGKFQVIVMKFCTVTTLGPRNIPAFSSIASKIGELGKKFGVQGTACPIMPKVLATCLNLIELVHFELRSLCCCKVLAILE
jgi:hypothetical protein